MNIPVLGPWIAKSAAAVTSSKTSQTPESSRNPNKSDTLVTIGKQSNRLDRLTKDGRKDGRGWTNIDTESEERIVESTGTSTHDPAPPASSSYKN